MAASNGDERRGAAAVSACASCGAGFAADQRYCLQCGERLGPLPAAVASWLTIVPSDSPAAAPPPAAAAPPAAEEEDESLSRYMPEPRAAAVAVMVLLAFGVLLGGLTGPTAQSAGIAPIVLYTGAEPAPIAAEPEEKASAPVAPAPVAETTAPVATVPLAEAPLPEEPPPPAPTKELPELPEEEVLPPITHVFLIVLGDNGYESAYGESSAAPYLATTLRDKGELLTNYYAVTTGDLANEIALISGQGPTPATAANCPQYGDVTPATLDAATGQVLGEGCVYPAETQSLPAQLVTAGKTWKAYIEGQGSGEAGQPASCRHPAPGSADEAQLPRPGDAYETWRNPFVYFHSVLDGPECAERDVGLDQLALDLKDETQTPSFSYIAPSACHAGDAEPCEPGQPGGLAAAQPFLETVVPEIEASDAYKKGGLIAITFAQAPQSGTEPDAPDASACCATPQYPNLPPPAVPPAATNSPIKETGGGGRVGMLLLSPFVEAGSSNESGYYNHFSFLLSVEELLGLSPPPGYAAEPVLTAFDSTVFNLGE